MNSPLYVAHQQLINTIKLRMKDTIGIYEEGEGYILYDMKNPEPDAHLRGATVNDTLNQKSFFKDIDRFHKDYRDTWTIRVLGSVAKSLEKGLEARGYICKDRKGSPIMEINHKITRKTSYPVKLVPLNQGGDKILELCIPVLSQSFDLSIDTSKRLLLNGCWTNNQNFRVGYLLEKDKVIGFGMFVKTEEDQVGGIYYISTLEEYRGRGIGKDIVTLLTNYGFQLGVEKIILQASKLGQIVYQSLGYQEIGRYYNYKKEG
ncbi:MAG: GNAT family N-acetyltransferase [Tissierellia bacterium]|nr:GNAT family N-acetyltransferase [Tissierellia bacterium]